MIQYSDPGPIFNPPAPAQPNAPVFVRGGGFAPLSEDLLQVMGGILFLTQFSELHQRYPVTVLTDRIMPSVLLNQFRYHRRGVTPLGFVNWAWLSAEVEARYLETFTLKPEDWTSGDRLWFLEILAPNGYGVDLMFELRTFFPEGTEARAVYVNPDGTFRRIQKFR